jgi:alkanesulfonate monooxygenase SsuD/methylene tetrahydromethanopterin reductase-like flavin-dependent oxidoreductase (luciferase family)
MRLGIGVGWQREELEAVGVDFATRGKRTDEAIEALQALWTEDEASYEGTFFSFDRVVSRPRPVRPGGIPIHVGGHSRAAARRAGRYGLGFQPLGLEGEELATRVAEMREAAVAAGRDPDAIELSLGGLLDLCDDAALAAAEAAGAHRLVLSTRNGDLTETLAEMSAFAERADLRP